jgi:hypothetical protein
MEIKILATWKWTALFAVLCVATGVAVGLLWYVTVRAIDGFKDMHPMDVNFYFRLYVSIGGVSGLFAWYLATLVARNRIRARSLVCIMAIPLMFILVLAADKNPITAVVVILLVAIGSIPMYIVVHGNKSSSRDRVR